MSYLTPSPELGHENCTEVGDSGVVAIIGVSGIIMSYSLFCLAIFRYEVLLIVFPETVLDTVIETLTTVALSGVVVDVAVDDA